MNKGEIWIVDIPETNGHEQQGTRPVVVISQLEANIAVVVPCTSNIKALKYPHVIDITADSKNGLSSFSIALVFQLRAIDQKRLIKKIGNLDEKIIIKIDSMILTMLDLLK